jgi:Ser/Thr protein kinase RdoA (MazF antagonist)
VERELARVLSAYGLGALVAARRIERGYVDENWFVETEQGRYVVKRRHPRRRQSEQVIQVQHDLIAHLRRSGFPAPHLIPTSTGQSFLVLEREVYEVGDYIEGHLFDHDRPEHLVAAAQTLGRYHLAVEGFRPQVLAQHGSLYSPANARRALTRLLEAWQIGADPDLGPLVQELEAQADSLAVRFGAHGALPHLVIHGDYYAGNLLLEGDRVIGVVDYDKASWQPRVAELAEALIYFASPRPGHLRHLVYPGFLEWESFSRFLQGYARLITLKDAETEALPDYIACIWFSISLHRLLENHPYCPPEAGEVLREVLELGNWARAHAGKVVGVARNPLPEEE